MQQRELRARHGDAHALLGHVRVERLDEVPRDDAARESLAKDPLGEPFRADASQESAEPDVSAHEAQLPLDVGELKVVHAHDLRAVRVDDLLVHEIARETERIRGKRRVGDAADAPAQPEVPDLLRDVRPFHDLLAVARGDDGPLHGRELTLRHDGEVLERADLIAIRLDHPAVLDLREVRHRRAHSSHMGQLSPDVSIS